MTDHLHDSGTRRTFQTGAVRDCAEGKGRTDLFQVFALMRLSKHLERGAKKYDDRNWEKGIPVSKFIDSGIRHALEALAGLDDEDHLAAALWNIACAIDTLERVNLCILPAALDDLPKPLQGFKKVNPNDTEGNDYRYYDTAFGKLAETYEHFIRRTRKENNKREADYDPEGYHQPDMEKAAEAVHNGIADYLGMERKFKVELDSSMPKGTLIMTDMEGNIQGAVENIGCITMIDFAKLRMSQRTMNEFDFHKYFKDSDIHFANCEFVPDNGLAKGWVIIETGKPGESQEVHIPNKYKYVCDKYDLCLKDCSQCEERYNAGK